MSVTACVISPLGCAVGAAGSSALSTGLRAFTDWVAGSTAWVFDQLGSLLSAQGSGNVVVAVASPTFTHLMSVAPIIATCALLAGVLGALARGDAQAMFKEAALAMVIIVIALFGAPTFARTVIEVVDAMCRAAAPDAARVVTKIAARASSLPVGIPGFAALLLDLAAVIGALVLWFELIVRDAILALLLALSPVVVAASLWRPARRLALRLAETFIAVALAKFVVVVALAMGASAETSSSPTVVITGIAVVLLAVFAPFALLRVVPLLEVSALHAMGGMRQAATAAVRRTASNAAAVSGHFGAVEPTAPQPREDLGIEEWPAGPTPKFPEEPDVPPEPPIGPPRLRTGHAVAGRDHMGPVIGWHFDE